MFFYSQQRKKSNKDNFAVIMNGWVRTLIDYMICFYLIVIIVVLPVYSENGYSYIASEKSAFFCNVNINMAKVIGPALILYLVLSLAVYYQKDHSFLPKQNPVELWKIIRRKILPVDFFAGLYAVALVLSLFCSAYREDALWGVKGWQMGFYPQIILLCIYFLISKLWRPRKYFFYIMFAVSAVVFLLGYLNRFSIYPIKMTMSSPGFISTIGNINWYCGYVVTVFFAGVALLWQNSGEIQGQKVLLAFYVWLGFATLATQGSASGIVALAVMMLILFVLSTGDGVRMREFWVIMLLLSGACLFTQLLRVVAPEQLNYQDGLMDLLTSGVMPVFMIFVSGIFLWQTWLAVEKGTYRKKTFQVLAWMILVLVSCAVAAFVAMVAVNTAHPGSLGKLSEYEVFTFSDTWGSNRGATWKAGIMCFMEQGFLHKLVGVGPDAMWSYISNDGSEELLGMVHGVFGTNLALTNAHNEWLTVLVNTGILGLIGFGGMVVSAVKMFIKGIDKNPIACACGFSLLAYTANNMFSFQQVVNAATVYAIMGMGMAFVRRSSAHLEKMEE